MTTPATKREARASKRTIQLCGELAETKIILFEACASAEVNPSAENQRYVEELQVKFQWLTQLLDAARVADQHAGKRYVSIIDPMGLEAEARKPPRIEPRVPVDLPEPVAHLEPWWLDAFIVCLAVTLLTAAVSLCLSLAH